MSLTFLRARDTEGLSERTVVLRFFDFDIAAVPARSPVSGLTFSLSVGMSSFEDEELKGVLFEREDEHVAMMFEVTRLALTASSVGTSWKTVKDMKAAK